MVIIIAKKLILLFYCFSEIELEMMQGPWMDNSERMKSLECRKCDSLVSDVITLARSLIRSMNSSNEKCD